MKSPGHLRIEEVRLTPGEEWRRPAGPWCFLRVTSGAAYFLDAVRPRALNDGELMVFAPAAASVIRASQIGEVVLHGFNFAPDSLYGFFTLPERQFFEELGASAAEQVRFLPSTHPLTQHFAALLGGRQPGQELAERAAALVLALSWFGQGTPPSPLPMPHGASALERFKTIVAQMPDLELLKHTPEELARLCVCSTRHFNRLFREQFGQSPRARQTELRLLKASHLLAQTDQRIAEIALASGYRSLSLFNALFKRQFGTSPCEWRQSAGRNG